MGPLACTAPQVVLDSGLQEDTTIIDTKIVLGVAASVAEDCSVFHAAVWIPVCEWLVTNPAFALHMLAGLARPCMPSLALGNL